MNELTEARARIEEIDKEMAALFEKRMKCSENIAAYKSRNGIPILDTGREQELLERNEKYVENTDLWPYYRQFMQTVMDISKQYQHKLTQK